VPKEKQSIYRLPGHFGLSKSFFYRPFLPQQLQILPLFTKISQDDFRPQVDIPDEGLHGHLHKQVPVCSKCAIPNFTAADSAVIGSNPKKAPPNG
jgi:hypothetical protein